MVTIKSKQEIEKMKEACRVAALAQKAVEAAIKPGVSTWELDKIAENEMRKNGAIPAEKGYPSGEKGVPDFPGSICASINDEVIHGIPSKKGNRIGDVSHAIGEFVEKNGFNVVKEFQGHGIGRQMHEDPGIPNYGKQGRGIRLEPGMTLAIEPMVMAGSDEILELEDGWTIITEDGERAAHYENTILITENEPEILTKA